MISTRTMAMFSARERVWLGCATDGTRRFREAYLEVPRKNGKSLLAATIGLYALCADHERGAEVYSGATSEKQAWETFGPARSMALGRADLIAHYRLEVAASNIAIPTSGSKFEPLIGKPGDGASPSLAIVDEYHEHQTPELLRHDAHGSGRAPAAADADHHDRRRTTWPAPATTSETR